MAYVQNVDFLSFHQIAAAANGNHRTKNGKNADQKVGSFSVLFGVSWAGARGGIFIVVARIM